MKIAYSAGHYIETAGRRVPLELDPKMTREWTLNDRVARHFAAAAAEYEDVQLLRCDDPTGKTFIDLEARVKKANEWGADFYLDIHHNAAGKVFDGGGITAYAYKEKTKAAEYRDAIYSACIAAGGLKGNRSNPTAAKGYYVLNNTKAHAVLMEYGFMNSRADAPVIITDEYSKLVAYATMSGIAMVAGLKKKPEQSSDVLYRVQVGAFSKKSNAESLVKSLKNDGYDAFIVEVKK